MYIVFAVIPRIPSDEGYSFSRKSGVYRDCIPVFRTSDEEVAKAVAELLTKDYEDGPGEDYPEGFIFKSEAEMSLKDRVRAHDQLSNLEDWALQMHEKATRYAEKARMLVLGDTETNEPSTAATVQLKNTRKQAAISVTGENRETVTLIQFMENYCQAQSHSLLQSRKKSLQKAHQKGKLQLPDLSIPWRRGQSKHYYADKLTELWDQYCKILPNLPQLDITKVKKKVANVASSGESETAG